jgi:tRNA (mo5U34)-methyltransferase
VGRGGFGITVEVPERVGQLLRRLRPAAGAAKADELLFRPPPEVALASRDAERRKIRDFLASEYATTATPLGPEREVAEHLWYHTIELPDGVVTQAVYDHRPLVPHYGLPDDLHGKRALDVGSGDGFWAFELERRGAEVTSVDIVNFADTDYPPAIRKMFEDDPVDLTFRKGIQMARRRLGSGVKLVDGSVYDLDPDRVGTFDFVHAGDLLLHLRDPALALQRLRSVTAGQALLADCFDPALDELSAGPGLTRYRGGWDDATWWAPAFSTLVQMVADAGFSEVEVLTTYRLPRRGTPDGPWRAVIKASA